MTVRARMSIIAALVLAFVGVVSATPTVSAAGDPRGLRYVALGDSYAAGFGIAPATKLPVAGCLQSAADYPHRVAKALRLKLTDVSCTGAVTANLISTPQRTSGGTAAPQIAALGRDTDVVTITIGGNDIGFFDVMRSCATLFENGPLLATKAPNCRSTLVHDGKDTLASRIDGTLLDGSGSAPSGLIPTFAAVRAAAPNAKVFVIGYPAIMPDAAHTPAKGCFRASIEGNSLDLLSMNNGFPFTDIDVAYLHSVEQKLDHATQAAAERAGFDYISTLAKSASHSACASTSSAYINGLTLQVKRGVFSLADGSLHPNARGAAFLARSVAPAVKRALETPPSTSTPGATQARPAPLWPWIVLPIVLALVVGAGIGVRMLRSRRRRGIR